MFYTPAALSLSLFLSLSLSLSLSNSLTHLYLVSPPHLLSHSCTQITTYSYDCTSKRSFLRPSPTTPLSGRTKERYMPLLDVTTSIHFTPMVDHLHTFYANGGTPCTYALLYAPPCTSRRNVLQINSSTKLSWAHGAYGCMA